VFFVLFDFGGVFFDCEEVIGVIVFFDDYLIFGELVGFCERCDLVELFVWDFCE